MRIKERLIGFLSAHPLFSYLLTFALPVTVISTAFGALVGLLISYLSSWLISPLTADQISIAVVGFGIIGFVGAIYETGSFAIRAWEFRPMKDDPNLKFRITAKSANTKMSRPRWRSSKSTKS